MLCFYIGSCQINSNFSNIIKRTPADFLSAFIICLIRVNSRSISKHPYENHTSRPFFFCCRISKSLLFSNALHKLLQICAEYGYTITEITCTVRTSLLSVCFLFLVHPLNRTRRFFDSCRFP